MGVAVAKESRKRSSETENVESTVDDKGAGEGEVMDDERDIIGRHLGFRARTVNALLRGATWGRGPDGDGLIEGLAPIKTLTQLAGSTMREVLRLRGAGKRTLRDCEKVLRAHGYTAENSVLLELIDRD